jgi:environmental stress-induced protein Ves
MRIIRQSAFKSVPWKNGGGVTHEALRVPESGDSFRLRVSVARIDASGAFSDFTGYTRTMVLLRGGGLTLRFADGESRALLRAGDLVEFDGAMPVTCELSEGPCVDLNLMVSRGSGPARARVERLTGPLVLPPEAARSRLIIPIDAAVDVLTAGEAVRLEPWDLALIAATAPADAACKVAPANGAALAFVAAVPDP